MLGLSLLSGQKLLRECWSSVASALSRAVACHAAPGPWPDRVAKAMDSEAIRLMTSAEADPYSFDAAQLFCAQASAA